MLGKEGSVLRVHKVERREGLEKLRSRVDVGSGRTGKHTEPWGGRVRRASQGGYSIKLKEQREGTKAPKEDGEVYEG